jgi:2-polyprenyl-6-methoxyphenol hydroxylase-like FAD-dependent oxidoreductase
VSDGETQVLIVGGGGAGLTASMLLSRLGVRSLLVNRLPGTSILPKAHVLNQRCMEIFDEVGVADAALDPVRIYEPQTRPGHPLPHAFVERQGERLPIGNLVHSGRFLATGG